MWKNFNKVLTNRFHQYIKIIMYHDQVRFIPVMQFWLNIQKLIHIIYHINRLMKKKLHSQIIQWTISIRQNPKVIHDKKKAQKNRKRELQLYKKHLQKPYSLDYIWCWETKYFPPKMRNKGRECSLLPLSQESTGSSIHRIKEGNEIKGIQISW